MRLWEGIEGLAAQVCPIVVSKAAVGAAEMSATCLPVSSW